MFDVIGGDIGKRSAGLIRAGGTLVSVVGPPEARPDDGRAVDFVVESDRAQLSESSGGCVTDGCGRTSATSRPSTTPSPPSTDQAHRGDLAGGASRCNFRFSKLESE